MYKYQRIKDLRDDKDLNQSQIAEVLGTSQKQYSRWERGEFEIPLHMAIQLARFYGVSLDYLTEHIEKHDRCATGKRPVGRLPVRAVFATF